DEYQDTNKIQYLLINLLIGKEGAVCVVGDPQQCIYTWRGAHPLNIIDFANDHGASETKLDINYRSTKKILDIANRVIAGADRIWEGKILELRTVRTDEGEVRYERAESGAEECTFIAQKIRALNRQGYRYSNIAVLMRMSFVSRGIEHTFIKYGIPYEIIGGPAFYARAEIRDMISFLRLISNKKDKAAFDRIINVPPRSMGTKTLLKVKDNYVIDWMQALKDTKLTAKQRAHADRFITTIISNQNIIEEKPYTVLMNLFGDLGYAEYLAMHYKDDYEDRKGNISELANVLKALEAAGKTFSEFLEDTVLSSDQDRIGSSDSVKVMTIHAA